MLAELALFIALSLQAGRGEQAVPLPDPRFRVIVHPANPVSVLSREQLFEIFMKKRRIWPDGLEVVPVDQAAASRVRERFSRAIHGKSVTYLTRYWHRLIFSGRGIPPIELGSNAAVIDYVRANRGAIGYVDESVELDEQVKVIMVTR